MHGPSFFSSLLVIFNFFPQINHVYYFTSLHDLQDVENHCTQLRYIELQTSRKIPFLRFPHVLFSIYMLESMKLQNSKNILASNPEKRTQKQAQKDMNDVK